MVEKVGELTVVTSTTSAEFYRVSVDGEDWIVKVVKDRGEVIAYEVGREVKHFLATPMLDVEVPVTIPVEHLRVLLKFLRRVKTCRPTSRR